VNADTPSETTNRCQYVEVRGPAGFTISPGTWFLSVEGEVGNFGRLNWAVDLGNFRIGPNGTLSMANLSDPCPGRLFSPGTTLIDVSDANVNGFGTETESYMLIFAPVQFRFMQNGDVDVNNDGLLDGGLLITPLDGIATVADTTTQARYAPLVFSGPSTNQPDAFTRFIGNLTPNSPPAWFYGELAEFPDSTTFYAAPLSPNAPPCPVTTPGNQNGQPLGCGAQFVNSVPITFASSGAADISNVPENTSSVSANPYPSQIIVSNLDGTVSSVRVTLSGFSHAFPDQVDVLLVGPQGEKFVIMGDAGGSTSISSSNPITLTFGDAGTSLLPDSGPLTSCFCEPTTWEAPQTNFPAPAPPGPYNEPGNAIGNGPGANTFAEVFGGTQPNGVWSLYVRDVGGNGMIAGGWAIEISTTTPAPPLTVTGRVTTPQGLGLRNAIVAMTDSQGVRRTATTSSFGIYTFEDVRSGESYILGVSSKRYRFAARTMVINDNLTNVDFVGLE
jgi:hypothetical protein